MSSMFEELMLTNSKSNHVNLTESLRGKSNPEIKKFDISKFKIESRRVLESENFDELDKQFAVNPESENDEGEVVLVIDPEIDSEDELPEDAAQNAIGDYVYKCPVCGSNYLCNCDADLEENVEVDENGVPKECPICGDDAEQILIGEIAPVEGAGEEVNDIDPVDPEDAEQEDDSSEDSEDSEVVEEGIFGKKKKYRVDAISTNGKDVIGSNVYSAKSEEDALNQAYREFGSRNLKVVEEGFFDLFKKDKEDLNEFMDANVSLDARGFGGKDNNVSVLGGKLPNREDKDLEEFLDIKPGDVNLNLDARGQSVGIAGGQGGSVTNPLDEDTEELSRDKISEKLDLLKPAASGILGSLTEDAIEEDELEFDEKRFESLVNQSLREKFKGSPKMKVESIKIKGNNLSIAYRISVGNRATKGTLRCEGFDINKRAQRIILKDKGIITESVGRESKFAARAVIRNGKLTIF